jgi:hypothetical protein
MPTPVMPGQDEDAKAEDETKLTVEDGEAK